MADEFEGAIEEAKRLERKLVEYAPYEGDIRVEKSIDFEPKEYVDLTYHDMINLYERNEKIISTVSMGLLATKAEEAPEAPSAEASGEIESKLRQMTSETLKEAEQVGKEPIVMEKEIPAQAAEEGGIKLEQEAEAPKAPAIEFETRPAAEAPKIEMEKPAPKEAEGPKPPEAELEIKPAEAPAEPRVEAPPAAEKTVIVAAVVPPALRESPDQAATQRYERMEEQVRSTLGEKADEATIKKKMLELTKQLFKEKTTSKREEIKLQIATLKNMLSAAEPGGARAAGAAKGAKRKDETHQKMYDAMLSTHQTELSQTKDSIIDSYNKQIAQVKKKFYEDIGSTDDPAKRKDIFEGFVFSIESLVHQLPEVIGKYREFTAKKHAAEMEKLRDSLSSDEKDLRGTVEGRLEYINGKYDQEFASVKGIIGREMDNLIEVAGSDIFKKPEAAEAGAPEEGGKPKETEARAYEVVREINETDEGTLLYFLHSKDPEYYKRYERKQLSKAEAIFKAKELMAKDKGLSDAMVKRYFTQMEG